MKKPKNIKAGKRNRNKRNKRRRLRRLARSISRAADRSSLARLMTEQIIERVMRVADVHDIPVGEVAVYRQCGYVVEF